MIVLQHMRCFAYCVASDLHCSNPLIRTMPATVLPLAQCTHAIPDTVISFKDSEEKCVDHVYLNVEQGQIQIFVPVSAVIKSKGTRSMRLRDWPTYKWASDPNCDPCLKSMRWYLLDQAFEGELIRLAPTDKRDNPFPGAHRRVKHFRALVYDHREKLVQRITARHEKQEQSTAMKISVP